MRKFDAILKRCADVLLQLAAPRALLQAPISLVQTRVSADQARRLNIAMRTPRRPAR